MPRYSYTAYNQNSKKQKGTVSAENSYDARKQLRNRGLHPLKVEEVRGEGGSEGFSLKPTNPSKLVGEFSKELSLLLKSGIKLTDGIGVLSEQQSHSGFKNALSDIRERVVSGESFAEAVKDYPQYFDVIYVNMARVGEYTGRFAENLASVANFMEKRQKMQSRLATAMIYPAILITFGIGLMIFFTSFVIPKMATQLQKMNQELPAVTKGVIAVSEVITNLKAVLAIVVVLVLIGLLFKYILRTSRGKLLFDRLVVNMPVTGKLMRESIAARFAMTLSELLRSGLPVAESLKVVSDVTRNMVMVKAIGESRDRIMTGSSIAAPLKDSGILDRTTAHMVEVGEKSGELELMLQNVGQKLEASTDTFIERLNAIIEPVIIIFIAAGIATLALAMILPIVRFTTGQI
ncbi:type II secretion system F family protein [Sedimentisphaera salicampi]|uniref:General secretion pathway protein F n=1 Tax=Sedimentisphaera salicampi TaxID=1941349 RepID=A0A1W6LPY2_9BACT|nr:type II secretion system F family protein [Sedimentisphaera salicampi]ARN57829.1 General secretion pathway protein F [Sedimentisphaera salicampi]OXU13997.1 General secretion pathway protein F [Sedimentisphaera salicampi]